jgi:hypothetical protein
MGVRAGLAVFGRAGVKHDGMGLPRRSASVVVSSFGMRTALLSRQRVHCPEEVGLEERMDCALDSL